MDVKAHPCAMLKLAKCCPTGIDMMASQFDLNVVVRQDARPEAQTGVLRISCNFACKIVSTLSISRRPRLGANETATNL